MDERLEKLFREVSSYLAFEQPELKIEIQNEIVVVSGRYDLMPRSNHLKASGKLDQFEIRLELPKRFPWAEPRLFETENRIPVEEDRHINYDGSCCYGVWEAWSALNQPVTFEKFMAGPVQDFFFSQHHFEQFQEWPFGEYLHGKAGLLQSYAETLQCRPNKECIRYLLRLFSKPWPKGHWPCPCGSGEILRCCCVDIHFKPMVTSRSAIVMLNRFNQFFD